jgi:hypothetical protein
MGHAAAVPPRSAVAKVRANIVIHICSAIAWRGRAAVPQPSPSKSGPDGSQSQPIPAPHTSPAEIRFLRAASAPRSCSRASAAAT